MTKYNHVMSINNFSLNNIHSNNTEVYNISKLILCFIQLLKLFQSHVIEISINIEVFFLMYIIFIW